MFGSRRPQDILRHPLAMSFYLPTTLMAFSIGLLAPVLPLYARDFQVSYGLVGLVLAGESLGMLIGDVPSGVLVRRVGEKRALLLGLVGTALSTGALFWAGSIPEVVAYRLVGGFALSLYNVARHAYITEYAHVGIRGRAIALMGGIMRIGRFIGPIVGGVMAARFGIRAPFLLFAATCGVETLMIVFLLPDTQRVEGFRSPGSGQRHGSLLSMLQGRYALLASAGAGQLFAQMIRAGRRIIVPLYGADVIGLDVGAIGLIVSLSSAVDMVLFYPAGWIMDRFGRKRAIVPSFLIQAAGMALVPIAGSFASLLAVASLMGLGNGLGSGSMMTLGADMAPEGSRGEFLGVWRWIGDIGSTGGPLIVGAVADLVVLSTAAWAMVGAGVVAGMIFALLVPETLGEQLSTRAGTA